MVLFLYALIVFVSTFLLQLLGIFIAEMKKRKKIKNEINVEQEYKNNMKIYIKILIALIISVVLGMGSLYGFGIATLVALREGH